MDALRACTRCGNEQGADQYNKSKLGKGGLDSWCKSCRKEYRKGHNVKYAKDINAYTATRRFEMLAATANLRARRLGLEQGVTAEQLRELHEEWNGTCCHCGKTEHITFDHIVPLSSGGPSTIENMQILCHRCNRYKGPFGIDFRCKPPVIVSNPVGAVMP